MSSDGQLWAAPFGFELPDPYILEVTMPAIRASLPCRDLSSNNNADSNCVIRSAALTTLIESEIH